MGSRSGTSGHQEMLNSDVVHTPPGQPNGTGAGFFAQTVGTWENISPRSGLTLIPLPSASLVSGRAVGGLGYLERWTFEEFGTPARDRGFRGTSQKLPLQPSDIFLGGLLYIRTANDTNPNADHLTIHGEIGQWLFKTMLAGEGSDLPWEVLCMPSIQHGSIVNAVGSVTFGKGCDLDKEYRQLSKEYSSRPGNNPETIEDYCHDLAATLGTNAGLKHARDPTSVLLGPQFECG
mmetsp:Transcript_27086/g.87445  ORF Transcript_27086/g.87445 Transcript_27086/m.87445 type:complete len:234 (-) Transcript_27086:596-1297(-)